MMRFWNDDAKIEVIITTIAESFPHKARLYQSLSAEEKANADSLPNKHRAIEFILGRGLLRELLGKRLILPPQNIEIRFNRYHKPELSPSTAPGIFFNLSHSHDVLAIALNELYPVGIDVEQIRSMENLTSLSSLFMSPTELQNWNALPKDKEEKFYQLWTQKEACLKCIGSGFFNDPATFDIKMNFLTLPHSCLETKEINPLGDNERYIVSWGAAKL